MACNKDDRDKLLQKKKKLLENGLIVKVNMYFLGSPVHFFRRSLNFRLFLALFYMKNIQWRLEREKEKGATETDCLNQVVVFLIYLLSESSYEMRANACNSNLANCGALGLLAHLVYGDE